MTTIVFTGGGTAGHVIPNFPLIELFREEGWTIEYIGSDRGPEARLVKERGISFNPIKSGKLRRYFSWKNFTDPFRVIIGIVQSYRILSQKNASVVFSKGGFVAFPVVVAAWLKRIPVVAHESDFSPGLANRLSMPFAQRVCLTFEDINNSYKKYDNVIVTGTPIRRDLEDGVRGTGLDICGFKEGKPVLMLMGGSSGAEKLNEVLRASLGFLLKQYQVIHLCGAGRVDKEFEDVKGYRQFEYVDKDLPHLLAAADIVVSRAGANSLYELLSLRKLHILIPLSLRVSRGDQVQNAQYFKEKGVSLVINDDDLTVESLKKGLQKLAEHKEVYLNKLYDLAIESSTEVIASVIKEQLNGKRESYSH